ncbi:MAG: hypothetical protein OEQ29_01965 [Alphaproteobacteria bacterium]|nr:hypothetical protein [Alphaproteobacteria bacterium]
MKRIIILAAVLAATTAAPLAGAAVAADSPIAGITAAADSTNIELRGNSTGGRLPCRGWYFQWKVYGSASAGRMWMRHCR